MSHSTGAVKFQDGTIKWVEYNGTVDVLQPKMFDTPEDLMIQWRTDERPTCNCKGDLVEIAVTYGNGFSWPGFACKIHNCVKTLDPHGFTEEYGLPGWYPENDQ